MTRLAFRSLASRPLRTVLTVLAILLGVAMITGTYVLTDQIHNGFADIFKTSFKGTAVQVAPKRMFASTDSSGTAPQTLNAAMLAQVRRCRASPERPAPTRRSAPRSWTARPSDRRRPHAADHEPGPALQPGPAHRRARGQARNEVSIIKSFADKAGLKPGDSFDVAAPAGLQHVTGRRRVRVGRLRLAWAAPSSSPAACRTCSAGRRARQAERHLDRRRPGRHAQGAGRA